MDDGTIAHWRLRNQRLSAPHAASAAEVVGGLLAVQAENPSQSAWAVAARTTSPDAGDLAGLLDSGAVARTHVLRPTWHYVARDDLDWLLTLTAPRIRPTIDTQLRRDLSDREIDHATTAVVDLLSATPDRTRDEVADAVRKAIPGAAERFTGFLAMVLMARLELDRLVSSGRPRDGEHTYALYADRVGGRVAETDVDRDDALARIALSYFTGHGPATVKDLAYWATLKITDVRRGLDAVKGRLASFDHGGRTYWHAPGEPPDAPGEPRGHLLQLLDEMYRGYQDSRWVVDAEGIVPRQREATIGIALVDGQLVAGMKRTLDPKRVRFDLSPHRRLTKVERRAIEDAAERYGEFLDRPAEITGW